MGRMLLRGDVVVEDLRVAASIHITLQTYTAYPACSCSVASHPLPQTSESTQMIDPTFTNMNVTKEIDTKTPASDHFEGSCAPSGQVGVGP